MNLYQISDELQQLHAHIEANDGEITEPLEQQLDALTMALDQKLGNIGKLMLNINAEAEALKAEEQRLAKKRKSRENLYERLKLYVKASSVTA